MYLLSVSEGILLFVSGLGIVQAFFLAAILIYHPKSDRSVTRFLALHIITLTLPVILPVAQHLFTWQTMILLEPLLALIAPFLYFYVRSFKEVITWKKAWPHFIFFVVCILMAWWDYTYVGSQYPPSQQVPAEALKHFLLLTPLTLRLAQRIIYYFLSRREVIRYQKSIQQLYSDTTRINLNWVRTLINGYFLLIIMTAAFYPLMLRVPQYFDLWILIQGAIVSVYIYIAAIKGIAQLTLWQIHPETKKETLEENINKAEQMSSVSEDAEKTRPRKAGLNDSKIDEIVKKIISLMKTEKLYQEPELTLQQLAEKLSLNSHQVSQAINDGMNKNFYDLVNGHRVEEAKRLLLDPKNRNYTILSVGFEAGFNSKTTFNTVFKKFTGLTPTEFRMEQRTPATVA
jgi:AraC-like DNA-binding protein